MDDQEYFAQSTVASASSSTRTVRPLPQPPPHVHGMTRTNAMTFTNYDTTHVHHYHPHPMSSLQPRPAPVPPARSSSLLVPTSAQHGMGPHVPSVQVIQPTPTKSRRYRRRSTGQHSVSSTEMSGSGSPRASMRPADGALHADHHTRVADQEEEDDDSESERTTAVLEARKARAREKGRDRQRRKRERDRIAREAAQSAGISSATAMSLTTSSHLPIPSRTPSLPNFMALSVPSSSSSSCSPLPVSTSYMSLSPGKNYNLSTGSTSVSGQSSPSVLFSPAVPTPGTSYGEAAGIWSMAEGAASMSVLDTSRGKVRGGKGKARASSTSQATGSAVATSTSRRAGPSPAKRRKSVPEPEIGAVSYTEPSQVGLGVSFDGSAGAGPRPHVRRMASDTSAQPSTQRGSPTRSPTPPPVPTLPAQYRHPSKPSSQAEWFADLIVGTLKSSPGLHGMLRQLSLDAEDLDGMKNELGGVYDRWRVTNRLDEVHIGQSTAGIDMNMRSTGGPRQVSGYETTTTPTSPKRVLAPADQSFFTPTSHRPPSRRELHGTANIMPLVYENTLAASQSSQVAETQDSPLAVHNASQHARARSLSSASMLARGLVLNPMLPAHPQQQPPGRWESEDENTSPGNSLLQTPSTGQGAFPNLEAMANLAHSFGMAQMNPAGGHWRSATDPTHARTYVLNGNSHGTLPQPAWRPLSTVDVAENSHAQQFEAPNNVGSTSAAGESPKHAPLQQYMPFTPHHAKTSQMQMMQTPFTPETPVSARGSGYEMQMGGMMGRSRVGEHGGVPMYYTTSMMNGSMGGGSGAGMGDMRPE